MQFNEILSDDVMLSVEIEETIYQYYNIKIIRSKSWGLVYILDDIIQTTEMDGFIYNEMITHVPLSMMSAKNVLLIGIGTGGSLREILKRNPKKVVAVDINENITEVVKIFGNTESLEDLRVHTHFQCGYKFVRTCEEKFDIIILDSPDPVGTGKILFSDKFFLAVNNILENNGIITTQWGVPTYQSKELIDNYNNRKMNGFFINPYIASIPTYHGGFTVFGLLSRQKQNYSLVQEYVGKYYNPEIHNAAFALPTYIKEILNLDE